MREHSTPVFYNRTPWNILFGIALVVAAVVGVARATTPWLLLVPLICWMYGKLRFYYTRRLALRRQGFFGGWRTYDHWIYEELRGNAIASLALPVTETEPGRHELFIPDDAQWRAIVPPWAFERRAEIALRVAARWKHKKQFHLPPDMAGT